MTTCPMHPKGAQGKEPKELKLSFWISLIGTIFLVFLPTSGVLNIGIEALLTTGIVFGCGRPLINQGLKSLARRKFNMFTLIFLGIGTSYLYSLAASVYIFLLSLENILHEMPLYFEAAGAITTFTLLGQFLEKSAEKKATSALHQLFDLAPKMARLVQHNQEIDIPISQIKVGDFLRIRAGEKVPTDGTIVEGSGSINASMITGESRPVFKQTGDFVMGATINEQGSFILQARQVGSDTVLSQIIEAVQKAQKSEIPIQKLVDRVSRYFVPIVIFIALCTFILWSFLSPTSTYFQALMSAISVLIIACPCALGLATPMALTIGIGQAATEGILIKNAKALEILSKATTIVFDKTGTLTEGKPRLVHQISFEAFSELEALQLAASLEQANIHPLGFAFLSKAQADNITLKPVEDFQNIEGRGISGIIEGKKTILGSKKILSDVQKNNLIHLDTFRSWQESGHTVLYLLVDGILTASFALCDPIKNEAKKVLETLHKSNKELILLTGDEPKAVQIFENEYPIDRIESGIFPIQKQTIIEQLQQAGKVVAMIGDGINDAPALAQAHVSIAMGQGSDIAIDAADIILMQGNLQLLLRAQELSLSTLSIVRQNLLFAFGYNVIAIGIAAGVLYPIFHVAMNPMLASMAMLLSSLSVTLNSLRLQKRAFSLFKPIYKAKAATLGGLILLGSHFYQDWQRHSMPLEPIEKSVQRILPSGESLLKIAPLKGGFANYIWDIHTENNHYILREKRKKVSPCSFMRDLKISQKAFQYHMGPQVLGANTSRQQILLEYIDHSSWPFYKKNFEPYQAAMKLLRSFHDQMPIHTHIDENTIYAPFYSIFNMRDTLLETSAEIPSHFFIAAKKMEEVFDKIRPWLQKHARLCHGDFCKANVLLSKKLTPTLIDFDSAFLGDPFFDIIKFSAALPQEKRLELFKSYLGDKEPTLEQLCHFKLMDLTFLMVIATLRFQSAQASDCLNEKLSKNSMEDILNREENLPSWSEVPFGNNSPLMKQTAALYALAEFLKRMPELESLISTFFSSEDSAYLHE